jgi:uncharacterized surface protein with fasciclin (FAS1) repeats
MQTQLFLIATIFAQVSNIPVVGSAPHTPSVPVSVFSQLESIVLQNQTEANGLEGIALFFNTLNQFPELVETLKSQDVSIFVPTNGGMRPFMNATRERLERLIAYHIVPVRVDVTVPRQYLSTHKGEMFVLVSEVNTFYIEYATNLASVSLETKARNGMLFKIDNRGLLIPPPSFLEILQMNQFSRLMELVHRFHLTDTFFSVREVSIFFPLNSAFDTDSRNRSDAEWSRILLNHITSRVLKTQIQNSKLFLSTALNTTLEVRNNDALISNYTIKSCNQIGANIVQFELIGLFGIGYTVDKLLLPEPLEGPVVYSHPQPIAVSAAILSGRLVLHLLLFFII